jgi:hypothetical protein
VLARSAGAVDPIDESTSRAQSVPEQWRLGSCGRCRRQSAIALQMSAGVEKRAVSMSSRQRPAASRSEACCQVAIARWPQSDSTGMAVSR